MELAKAAQVRPQVIYNLIRQGYLPCTTVEVTVTRKDIPQAEAEAWLKRRADRKAEAETS